MNHKDDLHPHIEFNEVFVPDDKSTKFPVYILTDAPSYYNKEEIGKAIIDRKPALSCTKRKQHVLLSDLLFFEPLTILPSLLQQLLDENLHDEKMSEEFVLDLAKEIGDRWQLLAQYFKLPTSFVNDVAQAHQAEHRAPYWAAHELLRRLESLEEGHGVQTYGELKESLIKISIFSEEELFKFADTNTDSDTEDSRSDASL